MASKSETSPSRNFHKILTTMFLTLIAILSEFREVFAFSKTNPLDGKTLMIIPMSSPIQFRFNDSAKLQEHMPRPTKAQVDILNWLAERYRFTYAVLPTNETTLEAPLTSGNRGCLSYLLDKTCDLVLEALVMTNGRNKLIDMPFPWIQRPLQFLIPVSDARANFNAVLKPFQFPVWILLVISIGVVIAALEGCLLFYRNFNHQLKQGSKQKRPFTSPVFLYISGIVLSQGGPCISRKITIRVVAGVWCLACFVLVQAYNSTLIPYVIAPNTQPLINSVYDIEKNPKIRFMIEKNMGYDIMLSAVTDDDHGIFRILRDRVNAYPESRCNFAYECLEKVESGGPFVYPKTLEYLWDAMLTDYKKTGKCRLQIAKEGFWNVLLSFALQKQSSYTTLISEGFLELSAFGLIEYWTKLYAIIPRECVHRGALQNKQFSNPRLSLKNLTGAFVVLVFGYTITLLIFVLERLQFARQHSRI